MLVWHTKECCSNVEGSTAFESLGSFNWIWTGLKLVWKTQSNEVMKLTYLQCQIICFKLFPSYIVVVTQCEHPEDWVLLLHVCFSHEQKEVRHNVNTHCSLWNTVTQDWALQSKSLCGQKKLGRYSAKQMFVCSVVYGFLGKKSESAGQT